SIVHDLSLAKKYGNKAMLLNEGKIVRMGNTSSVFSREALKDVYDMDVYGWMNDLAEVWQD
ncbi:MAG: ABC transporter ATP-binding protein, partial [Clostridiales bacterium]|nr:ABC transporter ATP-binding protein [Clostridiales bacterium]